MYWVKVRLRNLLPFFTHHLLIRLPKQPLSDDDGRVFIITQGAIVPFYQVLGLLTAVTVIFPVALTVALAMSDPRPPPPATASNSSSLSCPAA